MDPFARKMVLGAVAFGSVMALMAAAVTVFYVHTHPRCSDRTLAQADSPDRQWVASIAERRCGDDQPFFTHINLRRAGEPLRVGFFSGRFDVGEIFLVEQDDERLMPAVEWTSSSQLTIRCARCRSTLVLKHDQQWNGVTLRYELGP